MFDGNLTEAEAALTLAAVHGEYGGAGADKPEGEWPVIRAEVIRRLLLGQAVFQNGERMSAVPLVSGVRARGIRIEGPLDLTDARWPDGGPIQPFILEGATLPRLIASHAHIARLSLKNVRFSHIDLDGADIESDLEISDCEARAEGEDCYVTARNAHIDGAVTMRGARLKRTPREERPPEEPAQYALDLSGSRINGRLTLFPDFVAEGGVRFMDARIEGDVWMPGAQLRRGEGYAVNAQSARIAGSFSMRSLDRQGGGCDRFVADGGLTLWGIKIGGGLAMDGAYIDGMTDPDRPEVEGDALVLTGSEVGGSASLNCHQSKGAAAHQFEAKGSVWLNNAKLGGAVDFAGARINANSGPAISLANATVGGSMSLTRSVQHSTTFRTELRGMVDLDGASLKGGVDLGGACIEAQPNALYAANATIGQDFLCGWYLDGERIIPFKCGGTITLSGAEIRGNLYCYGSQLDGRDGNAVVATGCTIGGDATFTHAAWDAREMALECAGGLDLSRARIAGGLLVQGATLKHPESIALNCTNATIGKDFVCRSSRQAPCKLSGSISLEGASIAGALSLWGVRIAEPVSKTSLSAIDATIAGTLAIGATNGDGTMVRSEFDGRVDLSGTSIAGIVMQGTRISSGDRGVAGLNLSGAKLGNVLHLGPSSNGQDERVFAMEILGGLRLWGTRVSGRVEIGEALFEGDAAIVARELDVTGDLQLDGTRIKGQSDMRSATIGGQVSLKNVTLINDLAPHPVLDRLDEPSVAACIGAVFEESLDDDVENDEVLAYTQRFFSEPRPVDFETYMLIAGHVRPASMDWSEATLGRALIVEDLKVESTPGYAKLPARCLRPDIRLAGARTDTLQDLGGAGWGDEVDLILDGFRYNHITGLSAKRYGGSGWPAGLSGGGPEGAAGSKRKLQGRLDWLNLQHPELKSARRTPTRRTYRAQPFEQLAKVLDAQGDSHGAKAVLRHKLSIEGGFLPLVLRPFYWAFGALFGYGLAARRSIATLLAYVLIGTLLVQIALHRGQLAIDSTHTTTVAVGGHQTTPATLMPTLDTIACGDEITPWIFAVDVAAPLVDLGEERRCAFRAPRGSDPVLFSLPAIDLAGTAPSLFTWNEITEPMLWRWGRAIYALLGLLVTSLVVLTVTGVFRRAAER